MTFIWFEPAYFMVDYLNWNSFKNAVDWTKSMITPFKRLLPKL